MNQKYDQFTSATVANELAYFYPGGDWGKFNRMWSGSGHCRRFFVLADGHIGMGPLVMKETDIIAILFGGPMPYVLRHTPKGYMFLGKCYVHGITYGEQVNELPEETLRLI